MNIEDVVNSTAKAILVFWLRHWPLCLLTLWAVASLWASANINSTVSAVTSVAVVTASFVGTVACLKTFRLERCFWIYILAFLSFFGFPLILSMRTTYKDIYTLSLWIFFLYGKLQMHCSGRQLSCYYQQGFIC